MVVRKDKKRANQGGNVLISIWTVGNSTGSILYIPPFFFSQSGSQHSDSDSKFSGAMYWAGFLWIFHSFTSSLHSHIVIVCPLVRLIQRISSSFEIKVRPFKFSGGFRGVWQDWRVWHGNSALNPAVGRSKTT